MIKYGWMLVLKKKKIIELEQKVNGKMIGYFGELQRKR